MIDHHEWLNDDEYNADIRWNLFVVEVEDGI